MKRTQKQNGNDEIRKLIADLAIQQKELGEKHKEIQSQHMELVKQNILLGQRLDVNMQRIDSAMERLDKRHEQMMGLFAEVLRKLDEVKETSEATNEKIGFIAQPPKKHT